MDSTEGSDRAGAEVSHAQNQVQEASPTQEKGRLRLRIETPSSSRSSVENVINTSDGPKQEDVDTAADGHHGPCVKPAPSKQRHHKLEDLRDYIGFLNLSWISPNFDMAHFKPVIRASIALWLSLVLLVIPTTEDVMGNASFLILVAGFLSPPFEPFIAVLERELAILLCATVYFAYSCLGIRLADLARTQRDPSATLDQVFSGEFIEAWPTVICGIFLFFGTASLLYIRARTGPGPYVIALILSCIMTDITLTMAPLWPYPNYTVGESILRPLAFHSACAIFASAFIFPETINAQFVKRFRGVFLPLSNAMRLQPQVFAASPYSDDFNPDVFIKQIAAAETALAPLAAAGRLLQQDISWGRFGPNDFSRMHEITRRMAVRANGLAFYFMIIDPVLGKQVGGFSVMNTPLATPTQSRSPTQPPSPSPSPAPTPPSSPAQSVRSRSHRRMQSASQNLYHHVLNFYHSHHHRQHRESHHHSNSLFSEMLYRSNENAVGIFESARYLNLESRLSHPNAEELIPRIMNDLAESSHQLIEKIAEGFEHIQDWLRCVNENRFWKLYRRQRQMNLVEALQTYEAIKDKLQNELNDFREKKRHQVLTMYRPHINPETLASEDPPPHKYLFQAYLYQYHLIFFTEHVIEILHEIIVLERARRHSRLWLPTLPLKNLFIWRSWEPTDANLSSNEDEDPDVIQGIDPHPREQLGEPRKRDPDALPPTTRLELVGSWLHRTGSGLGHGNAVFGIKAGILSVLLSLPNFLPSSANFAYRNRSIWGLVIGQLTLSRFRGDTTFGWVSRIFATFTGGLIGTVMWYISTGTGQGNAYGLAAVCAVGFPMILFIRMYFPAPPMTLIILVVTVSLVVGYSWQDVTLPTLATQGAGIDVAWKRFLLVVIGVSAASIFSFLPPTATLRRNLRMTYATTVQQLGQAYCDVVSNAMLHDEVLDTALIKDLIAIRLKLNRTRGLMVNVPYELSLRGKWPKERYLKVHEIQMEIAYLLSHLRSVTSHLEKLWSRAFLKRTRFLEPDFQGDVLAVISMVSTALRTGAPLPQVTPCPLLDRFASALPGLHIMRKGDEEDFGLPRTITIETLENEQYLYYSVGSALAWGIVLRLDRLMVATKELVGEQYHIHGLPLYNASPRTSQRGVA